jgi:hypothetical protein
VSSIASLSEVSRFADTLELAHTDNTIATNQRKISNAKKNSVDGASQAHPAIVPVFVSGLRLGVA